MKIISTVLLFLSSLSLYAQISDEGLLAYYPFDNNVLDLGPDGYNGVLNGGSFAEDQEGNLNAALLLNGLDQFLDLSEFANTFRENTSLMTIYFKIRFEEEEDEQTILSLGSQGENISTNVFEIEYENDRLQIETETSSFATNHELEIDGPLSFFDGQWHEVMIVLNGDSITYCKDEEVIFKDVYTPAETLSDQLFIGCFNGAGTQSCCFFGGYIDELQFYNRVLDKKELSVNNVEVSLNDKIQIYPNPTVDQVNINLDQEYKSLKVTLTDAAGEIIQREEVENLSTFQIDIPEPEGVYFLNIQSSTAEYANLRIIKLKE